MRCQWTCAFWSLAAVLMLSASASGQGLRCERLAQLTLPTTEISIAETVPAGAFVPPSPLPGGAPIPPDAFRNLPAFCRVAATLRPSADSDIKIEVWMPVGGWNGKFQAVGNGGWAGSIFYGPLGPSLAGALRAGYATAGTDTGHAGTAGDGKFAFGHPEKVVDFAY